MFKATDAVNTTLFQRPYDVQMKSCIKTRIPKDINTPKAAIYIFLI